MDFNRTEILEIFNSIDFNQIQKHPNILIAANFWEEDRFRAAKICYKYMRAIDDMIDDFKANNPSISPEKSTEFRNNIENWLESIAQSDENKDTQNELFDLVNVFKIPLWTMENFATSMIYDIDHDGFPTLQDFINYSMGASVSPAAVFVHLNGLTKKDGDFHAPAFDVKECTIPCSIFSYLVHIIRDFQQDQQSNLNYFADDLIAKHGLDRSSLRAIADGAPVSAGFRKLIEDYYREANLYCEKTYDVLKRIKPLHEPRYQLSLEMIFDLYRMVFERIDLENGQFTAKELNPTPEEIRERVYQTIMKFEPVPQITSDNLEENKH